MLGRVRLCGLGRLCWGGLCLLLAGCSTASRTIYVVPRDTAEAFWVSEHTGAAAAAAHAHVKLYWNGPNGEDDVERQITLAERAIHDDAMGLVLSPSSPFALNTVVQRALASKMPVVILGAPVPLASAPQLYFVEPDVAAVGRLAVQRVAQAGGEVGVIGIDPLTPGSVDRLEAFTNALRDDPMKTKLVARLNAPLIFGQLELETERMIRAHPGLTAIFALNVTSTRATVAAVRVMHAQGRIRIVGCDQTLDLLFMLRSGDIDALVIQNMPVMGRDAVEDVVSARHKRSVPSVITVAPALLTRGNIDTDAMQDMLLMDWRVGS
jgi:ribose transport system substrate-binding protein